MIYLSKGGVPIRTIHGSAHHSHSASGVNSEPRQRHISMQRTAVWLVHTRFRSCIIYYECVYLCWESLCIRQCLGIQKLISINTYAQGQKGKCLFPGNQPQPGLEKWRFPSKIVIFFLQTTKLTGQVSENFTKFFLPWIYYPTSLRSYMVKFVSLKLHSLKCYYIIIMLLYVHGHSVGCSIGRKTVIGV